LTYGENRRTRAWMKTLPRCLRSQIDKDLAQKMVLVGGPRQVGKTTLARGLRYLRAKYPAVGAWQLSAAGNKDYVTRDGIRVAPARTLLQRLV